MIIVFSANDFICTPPSPRCRLNRNLSRKHNWRPQFGQFNADDWTGVGRGVAAGIWGGPNLLLHLWRPKAQKKGALREVAEMNEVITINC
jgi:hypothetical protein